MALHTNLPVYKLCYDLTQKIADVSRNIPRDFKATYGSELRTACIRMLVLIGRANQAQGERREEHLTELLEHHEVVTLLVRLAQDMRWISRGQYSAITPVLVEIGKQAGGWRISARGQGKKHAASPVA